MQNLNIVLIDDDKNRADYLQECLIAQHFNVLACLTIDYEVVSKLEKLNADIILLDMDNPKRDIIENCVSQFNLPTVLFTKNSDQNTIKHAIDAGVTAYIVDGIDPQKLHSILTIAIEQFKKYKKLETDLKETKMKLADRKDVEKAKALLMQLHQLSEPEAFQQLRKMAMNHRMTIGQMSRRLIEAQQLLNHDF